MTAPADLHSIRSSGLSAYVELLKPITWFPPVWAFACGTVAAGLGAGSDWAVVIMGLILAGPVVCGMSQVVNDYFDRNVDAINEPQRPIPSGRVAPRYALGLALALTLAALALGAVLGPWAFGATCVAVIAAWAYSAPPLRMKRSGFWGPGLVGMAYEGLPWFTGAAILSAAAPAFEITTIALLYAIGAHGIMTLNDFKAIEGDRRMGIRSLPVVKGPAVAARLACTVIVLPQLLVVALLPLWGAPIHAAIILAGIAAQIALMRRLLRDPEAHAPWYNGTGVLIYVTGMMVAAFALRGIA